MGDGFWRGVQSDGARGGSRVDYCSISFERMSFPVARHSFGLASEGADVIVYEQC